MRTVSFPAQIELPAIQYRDFVAAGGAINYGGDIKASYYHAATYAGRILSGEKRRSSWLSAVGNI
jgi:hypothetical protein